MANFLSACRSRNEKELHDPISNAYLSASLCHLANISYRAGRKLTLEAGPKFAGDAEATRMLTRPKYRAPYIVWGSGIGDRGFGNQAPGCETVTARPCS